MDMIEAFSIDEKGLVTVNDPNSLKNSSKKLMWTNCFSDEEHMDVQIIRF